MAACQLGSAMGLHPSQWLGGGVRSVARSVKNSVDEVSTVDGDTSKKEVTSLVEVTSVDEIVSKDEDASVSELSSVVEDSSSRIGRPMVAAVAPSSFCGYAR